MKTARWKIAVSISMSVHLAVITLRGALSRRNIRRPFDDNIKYRVDFLELG